MKIKKISIKNFKAISEKEIDFNGCSAIITAGNNKGKTSLLRGLIDRIRGEKPELIVKQDEKKGFNIVELSDGSLIEWKFTEKSESFAYTTKEGIKQTTGVISTIGKKLFGTKFDIDVFLNSSPDKQVKELQNIVGLDFTEIDKKYKEAYDNRTLANNELKRLRAISLTAPEKVEKPEIDILKKELEKINAENHRLKENWKVQNEKHLKEIQVFNDLQRSIKETHNAQTEEFKRIHSSLSYLQRFFDFEAAQKYIFELKEPEPQKEITNLPEPNYTPISEINNRIDNAQEQLRKFDACERELADFNKWVEQGKVAKLEAEKCDSIVQEIKSEKRQMINGAKIPNDFEITDNNILYKGLPLTNSQQSSSARYIAALKLGALVLGKVRTLHFDASFLDKKSLAEVQEWANKNDLQLLIERPDFDGGEIKYDII